VSLSPGVAVGLLFAVLTAFVGILGFLFKFRGAQDAAAVEWRHPVKSTIGLFSNKWWTIGILVAMGSWVFHVTALALAPISLVQATIAAGLVLLTPVADKLFGLKVGRREWFGVGVTAVGLAILAGTLGDVGSERHGEHDGSTLALYVGLLSLASVPLMVLATKRHEIAGTLLAVAAGLQWGASDVTIKAASNALADDGVLVLFTPLALTILVLSLVGLVVSARSLQLGEAVGVIAVTSAAANLCTIASGVAVFGEPVPEDTAGLVLRVLAFALVILAASLTPPPAPKTPEPV
jgi:hypothetical protein